MSSLLSRAVYSLFFRAEMLSVYVFVLAGCGAGSGPPVDAADATTVDTTTPPSPSDERDASSTDGGASQGTKRACEKYLSCLLAVTPAAYAAALTLYGEDSACWATPEQVAGCAKACESAFSDIEPLCTCEGVECTKCEVPYGNYNIESSAPGCSDAVWGLSVANIANQPSLQIRFTPYESVEAPLSCGSPSTFDKTTTEGCSTEWSGELGAPSKGTIVVSGTKVRNCPGGPSTSCTFRWQASLVQ